MKVSLNWVEQYTKVDVSAEELTKLATERLGGLEGVTDLAKQYEGIVVAKIVSCEQHPNADKLHVCMIDDGGVVKDVARDEHGLVQVVCGAPNAREGMMVAWIPPRSVVPSSYGEKELFVLEARELRGQLSNGMLASPRELGINEEHDGILEIGSNEAKPGQAFKELFDLDDTILDIENKMFTHRPDCFGQLGVAREIAGIQGEKFISPEWYTGDNRLESYPSETMKELSVTNEVEELCPRYTAVMLDNIEIKPSPLWLQSYLKRVGMRPINNVVDITNYVMLLTAQPLHAFDFDKFAHEGRASIVIRRPKKGEKVPLLDGRTIEPYKDAVLICNQEHAIGLGGIMGGGNSEVDTATKRVILECANFNMYNVRKTCMTHGIFTDAATRFTKGQPVAQIMPVLYKAVKLFEELAGANVAGDIADSKPDFQPEIQMVSTTADFISKRLGKKFSADEIKQILENVEFEVDANGENLRVKVPFWRTDIELPEDIVEEVGRLQGFNQLPMELPRRSIRPTQISDYLQLKKRIREVMSRAGANEVLTYSFVHGNLLKRTGQETEDSYVIRNALSPDLQYFRQTLTPSLLELIHPNIKAGYYTFTLFELNRTHNKIHGLNEENVPGELNMMAFVFADNGKNETGSAYYTARKYLAYLVESLGFTLIFKPAEKDADYPVTRPFDLSRSAFVIIKETDDFLGMVGEYRAEVVRDMKLPVHSAGFEIGPEVFIEAAKKNKSKQYTSLGRFPSTEKDLTVRVDDKVLYADIQAGIDEVIESSDYQISYQPLSIFQKPNEATKNVSFRFTLSHADDTLTTETANKIIQDISYALNQKVGAEQI